MKVRFQSAKTALIAALLQHDSLSRLDLCELTGVSRASVIELSQKLLQRLPVEIPSAPERRRGRPTAQLLLEPGHSCLVGINLGEGETLLALTDINGQVLEWLPVPATELPADIPEVR